MSKTEMSLHNRDMFTQIGISIAALRKYRGMSQDDLAEKAEISRSHLSAIETPHIYRGFSMNTFLNIAAALEISPEELLRASRIAEHISEPKTPDPQMK